MIKKIFSKFNLILILSLIFFTFSCSDLINGNNSNFQNNPAAASDNKFYFSIRVADWKENADIISRTLRPPRENGSSVSKYVLKAKLLSTDMTEEDIGLSVGETKVLGSWTSISQMSTDQIVLYPGCWDLSLYAYKMVDGVEKIYAVARKNNVESPQASGTTTLDFTFSFNDEATEITAGTLDVKFNLPLNGVTKVNVQLYTFDSDGTKQYQTLSQSEYIPEAAADGSGDFVSIVENNIPRGYYFLRLEFFTDSSSSSTATRVNYVKILGGQSTSGEVTYTDLNKSYSITYADNVSGDGDEEIDNSANIEVYNSSTNVTLQDPLSLHYDFGGWYDNSACTGSPVTGWTAGSKEEDVVLYAKWTPKKYRVYLYDFSSDAENPKSYSGNYDNFNQDSTGTYYELSYRQEIPSADTFDTATYPLSDGNTVTFAGYYTDNDCNTAIPDDTLLTSSYLEDSDSDGVVDRVKTFYAKWNYKYIYVDPPSVGIGSDTNKGFSPSQALATIDEAKFYLIDNPLAEKVYVLDEIVIDSADSPNNPSGISDTSTYGDGTNPVIVIRHSTFLSDALLNISVDTTLYDVILDGGAVWDDEGPAGNNGTGVNTGHTSECSLIVLYKTGELPELTLDSNVVIQNNDNTGTTYPGGGIRVYGKLFSNSTSNVIRACRSYSMGGGIFAGQNSELTLTKGLIGGEAASDGNVSVTGNGSAIYAVSNVSLSLGASGGYSGDFSVKNNYTPKAGAVFLRDGSTLIAYNAVISNNTSDTMCGGVFINDTSSASFESCTISNNSSSGRGGAIALLPDTDDSDGTIQSTLISLSLQGTVIQHNSGSYGGALSLDCGDVNISSCVISNNVAQNQGGAVYICNSAADMTLPSTVVVSNTNMFSNQAGSSGGAVFIGGKFQMDGGSIYNNTCVSGNGGGIVVASDCKKDYYSFIRNVSMQDNVSNATSGVSGQNIHINSAGYFTIDSSDLSLSDASAISIVNTGRLYVSGKGWLSNVYLSNSSYGFIFPRNYFAFGSGASDREESNLLAATDDGETYATLTSARELPTVNYVDSDSTTYIVALKEETAGDMSGLTNSFKMNVNTHYINESGHIRIKGMVVDDGISDSLSTVIYFKLSSETITSTEKTLTITAYSDEDFTPGNEITDVTDWWCNLLYNNLIDTGAVLVDGSDESTKTITFETSEGVFYQAGTYTLTVGATLNGVACTDSFTITVSE